ncbi:LOW QUALITY PROTEIN: hypothetical protein ElyMa_006102800 [Elysia marginata]|uniref:Uncharacterized protein n=1 Tax=Elysia marginata TaxID=1093978 RepID=A0AAV4GTB7_9GAST|nr:LOW QUALITY PROTEIN: hypothetical protein ElyMa_006102800 [Elysia marginata]
MGTLEYKSLDDDDSVLVAIAAAAVVLVVEVVAVVAVVVLVPILVVVVAVIVLVVAAAAVALVVAIVVVLVVVVSRKLKPSKGVSGQYFEVLGAWSRQALPEVLSIYYLILCNVMACIETLAIPRYSLDIKGQHGNSEKRAGRQAACSAACDDDD